MPTDVPRLVAVSQQIRSELNSRLTELLDDKRAPDHIPQLLFISDQPGPGSDGRTMATSSELGYDRSPCETGSCARMAMLFHRGELSVGERFVHESVTGSRFVGAIVGESPGKGIIPSIRGSAFITGYNKLVMNPRDPLGPGFFIPAAD